MKKIVEKQFVFNLILKLLYFLTKFSITRWTIVPITSLLARINLKLNKPAKTDDIARIAETWKVLMPPDGQDYFKISTITEDTAYVEIHLECPLRASGNVNACHAFMNYDRELMNNIGGNLIVLESHSNSGKQYCTLAIRKLNDEVFDLIPAHLRYS